MKTIKVEHIWSEENDRWIYIEYNEQMKITGLNFCQGDDYDDFANGFSFSDVGLMEFYREMLYTFPIELASVDTITFINKVMWTYTSAGEIRATFGY
jgi:hypothetical protein